MPAGRALKASKAICGLFARSGLDRQVVRVDIKKVINGKAPDPVLQAEDIVFLPTNSMKAAIKNGGIGTLLGIVSILLVATGV